MRRKQNSVAEWKSGTVAATKIQSNEIEYFSLRGYRTVGCMKLGCYKPIFLVGSSQVNIMYKPLIAFMFR